QPLASFWVSNYGFFHSHGVQHLQLGATAIANGANIDGSRRKIRPYIINEAMNHKLVRVIECSFGYLVVPPSSHQIHHAAGILASNKRPDISYEMTHCVKIGIPAQATGKYQRALRDGSKRVGIEIAQVHSILDNTRIDRPDNLPKALSIQL